MIIKSARNALLIFAMALTLVGISSTPVSAQDISQCGTAWIGFPGTSGNITTGYTATQVGSSYGFWNTVNFRIPRDSNCEDVTVKFIALMHQGGVVNASDDIKVWTKLYKSNGTVLWPGEYTFRAGQTKDIVNNIIDGTLMQIRYRVIYPPHSRSTYTARLQVWR